MSIFKSIFKIGSQNKSSKRTINSLNNTLRKEEPVFIDTSDTALNFKEGEAYNFHKSLPGYNPTDLINLKSLSKKIGISDCLIKDESQRLGLNAFKVLGASFAMAKIIQSVLIHNDYGARFLFDPHALNFQLIKEISEEIKDLTFVTATDGNHGRAIAWCAEKFGCKAVVYMPKGSSRFRLESILSHGARAEITELNYDETVRYAAKKGENNHWNLLQDTSWSGYELVAKNIMIGYQTILSEFVEQGEEIPTHVIAQAGVGSYAASIFDGFSRLDEPSRPKLILLEPSGAACFFNSVRIGDGKPHLTRKLDTIMAGLSCGMPSKIAWETIASVTDKLITCDDSIAEKGMRLLANPTDGDTRIISGESGALPLGFLYEVCTNKAFKEIKEDLELNSSSKVFFISTEGDTDPELYNKITSMVK